jgi:hypothetical protein
VIEQENKEEDNHIIHFVKNAIDKGFKMVICVEDKNKCMITCTFAIDGEDKSTARFLEKFARSHRE